MLAAGESWTGNKLVLAGTDQGQTAICVPPDYFLQRETPKTEKHRMPGLARPLKKSGLRNVTCPCGILYLYTGQQRVTQWQQKLATIHFSLLGLQMHAPPSGKKRSGSMDDGSHRSDAAQD
ncbi:hypothetical protein J6590_030762 [Homalodisca vitripennis]|nr:hypothetical protein J6590_030762 [Homalodisca vitripennis]